MGAGFRCSPAAAAVSAHKLLKLDLVQAEITKLQAEDRAASKLSIDAIQSKLLDLEKRAKERNDLNAERGAIELQGKTIGAFTDRLETNSAPLGSDADVAGKLAVLIINALSQAGCLAKSQDVAQTAILAALQGKSPTSHTLQ